MRTTAVRVWTRVWTRLENLEIQREGIQAEDRPGHLVPMAKCDGNDVYEIVN